MKTNFHKFTLIVLVILLAGCNDFFKSDKNMFSIISDGNGKIIRINTTTGSTCTVGENCELNLPNLVKGESYIYEGNGVFKHQKVINWKDLK